MQSSQIQLFTKIQQSSPSLFSTISSLSSLPPSVAPIPSVSSSSPFSPSSASTTSIINKQVGYMVHIETDKLYKLKNTVDSQKNNAELYKRISKDFITNIKKGEDQMIICCGMEEETRMQTSIGNGKNPGMFLIAGISVLDQKYQQNFIKFDVQVGFISYVQGKFYDLLCWTGLPLKVGKKDQIGGKGICFGQSYCKINTFNQFLKLFKIALFNNKQRESQKTHLSHSHPITPQQKIKSSMIMTLVTKKYPSPYAYTSSSSSGLSLSPGQSTQVQKSILIDMANSRSSSFVQEISEIGKGLGTGQEGIGMGMGGQGGQGNKSIWDYFMIEMNNLTSKKKMFYHLVEPNPLLIMIKNILKNGKLFILNSFGTRFDNFQWNYRAFVELESIVQAVCKQKQDNNAITNMNNPNLFSTLSATLPLQTTLIKQLLSTTPSFPSLTISSAFPSLSPLCPPIPSEPTLSSALLSLLPTLSPLLSHPNPPFPSLRHFRLVRHHILSLLSLCIQWLSTYSILFTRLFEQKCMLKLYQNQYVADQIKLIGQCVKGEGYREFYGGKGYVGLEREMEVKGESVRERIGVLGKNWSAIRERYYEVRAKCLEGLDGIGKEGENAEVLEFLGDGLGMAIGVLPVKMLELFHLIFQNAITYQQRTLYDQILKEEEVKQTIGTLHKKFGEVYVEIQSMGNQNAGNKINIEVGKKDSVGQDRGRQVHLSILIKQVKNLIKKQQKKSKSKQPKLQNPLKTLLNSSSKSKQNKLIPSPTSPQYVTKFTKLPAICLSNNKPNIHQKQQGKNKQMFQSNCIQSKGPSTYGSSKMTQNLNRFQIIGNILLSQFLFDPTLTNQPRLEKSEWDTKVQCGQDIIRESKEEKGKDGKKSMKGITFAGN